MSNCYWLFHMEGGGPSRCLGYIMPLCPAELLSIPVLQYSYPYCSLILLCIFFVDPLPSFHSTNPTSTMEEVLWSHIQTWWCQYVQKFIKIFIFAFVFLFVVNEIEQYTHISDQYPMACNMMNSLVCVVLCMLYSDYM